MTKISIDVDFNKDPEVILREIQEKAKSEVQRREKKERAAAHLEILHNKVNEDVGTSYNNVNELIRALALYATPSLRGRILGTTTSGRRKTVTMSEELYGKIKASLAESENTKAEIAREHGVSPTQVTKVERGGYDAKYGGKMIPESPSSPEVSEEAVDEDTVPAPASEEDSVADADQSELAIPDLESKQEELPMPDSMIAPLLPESQEMSAVADVDSDQADEEDTSEIMPEESQEENIESFGDSLSDVPEPPEPAAPQSPEPTAPEPPEPSFPPVPDPIAPAGVDESTDPLEADESIPTPGDVPLPPTLEPNIPALGAFTPPPPPEPIAETEESPLADAPVADQEDEIPQGDSSLSPVEETPAPPAFSKLKPSIKMPGKSKTPLKLSKGKYSDAVTRPPIAPPGDQD